MDEVFVEDPKLPPFIPFLICSLILIALGFGGLFVLLSFTLPTLFPRWLFFFLSTIGFSGLALPIVYFLNLRFQKSGPVKAGVLLRQAIWFGIYIDLLAWFQLGRVLSLPLGVALAGGFFAIEFALRLAERSRFTPRTPHRNA